MLPQLRILFWPSTTFLHWKEISLVVLVQSSMRSTLPIVSHLRSDSNAYPTSFGGGAHLTPGYAGCGGDMPQPVPVVQQHGGTGEKERWITALLHGFSHA